MYLYLFMKKKTFSHKSGNFTRLFASQILRSLYPHLCSKSLHILRSFSGYCAQASLKQP
nr:MAG TPA: hypothetical protein [Caudoviricetes sp.]